MEDKKGQKKKGNLKYLKEKKRKKKKMFEEKKKKEKQCLRRRKRWRWRIRWRSKEKKNEVDSKRTRWHLKDIEKVDTCWINSEMFSLRKSLFTLFITIGGNDAKNMAAKRN